jgi:hypothetical protein
LGTLAPFRQPGAKVTKIYTLFLVFAVKLRQIIEELPATIRMARNRLQGPKVSQEGEFIRLNPFLGTVFQDVVVGSKAAGEPKTQDFSLRKGTVLFPVPGAEPTLGHSPLAKSEK